MKHQQAQQVGFDSLLMLIIIIIGRRRTAGTSKKVNFHTSISECLYNAMAVDQSNEMNITEIVSD